jgi:hypothetical protein
MIMAKLTQVVPVWQPKATVFFNRLCNLLALAFLMASALQSLYTKPPTYDFCQYYMGGVIARHGSWDSLYPVPKAGSEKNPSYPTSSTMRPEYAELVRAAGVDDNARFIQPPPVALLMLPFASFNYRTANGLWVLAMTACLWLVALQAARVLRLMGRKPSRVEGLLVLFIACSPLYRQAMRIGNVSPFVAMCVGAASIGLVAEQPVRSSLGIVLGAFGKYVTLIFLPLYLLARKCRTLAVSLTVFLTICLATLAVSGARTFITFARDMVPTFGRPDDSLSSITAHSFIARWYGGAPIPRAAERAVRAVELVLIVLGATGLLRSRKRLADDPVKLLAASLAMVGGFLIFSPLAWGHYLLYLVPLWGYLVWEAGQSPRSRWVVAAALPFLWFPRDAVRSIDRLKHIRLPALAESYELWGMLLVVAIAILRLHKDGQSIEVCNKYN